MQVTFVSPSITFILFFSHLENETTIYFDAFVLSFSAIFIRRLLCINMIFNTRVPVVVHSTVDPNIPAVSFVLLATNGIICLFKINYRTILSVYMVCFFTKRVAAPISFAILLFLLIYEN